MTSKSSVGNEPTETSFAREESALETEGAAYRYKETVHTEEERMEPAQTSTPKIVYTRRSGVNTTHTRLCFISFFVENDQKEHFTTVIKFSP